MRKTDQRLAVDSQLGRATERVIQAESPKHFQTPGLFVVSQNSTRYLETSGDGRRDAQRWLFH
jgi:hypothetical protein